jgi:regulator of sigma E protease
MSIIIALLIFSFIIIIHELGHFIIAKKNGIGVEEFALGMGPKIISFKRNGTIYSIKLFPIGGACMMTGEDELSYDPKAFGNQSVLVRMLVVFAGPLFNFVLAFLLAIVVVIISGFHVPIITEVIQKSPAEHAGIRAGDVITRINNQSIHMSKELSMYFYFHDITEKPLDITYLRKGKEYTKTLYPMKSSFRLGFTYSIDDEKVIVKDLIEGESLDLVDINIGDTIVSINGVNVNSGRELYQYFQEYPLTNKQITLDYVRNGSLYKVNVTPSSHISYDLGFTSKSVNLKPEGLQIVKYAYLEVKYSIVSTLKGLGYLLTGKVTAEETMGAVGLVNEIGKTYNRSIQYGIINAINALAGIGLLLSANLGVMNLLPIPALDGGRLMFLLLEVLRGKPMDQQKEGIIHFIGFTSLIILIMLITINDISKII